MEQQRLRQLSAGSFGRLLCGCVLRKEEPARLAEPCARHRDTGFEVRFDLESWVRPCPDPFLATVTVRIETQPAEPPREAEAEDARNEVT